MLAMLAAFGISAVLGHSYWCVSESGVMNKIEELLLPKYKKYCQTVCEFILEYASKRSASRVLYKLGSSRPYGGDFVLCCLRG